jgi:hypothetical protein
MELAADILQRNLEMVKMTLSDFSDADMMVRPCPGANHPAWQLGHLINVEAGALKNFNPSAPSTLPPDFEKKFTKETCGKDDASLFPRRTKGDANLYRGTGQIRTDRFGDIHNIRDRFLIRVDRPEPDMRPALAIR